MRAAEFVTEVFEPKTAFELEWDESFAPDELHAMAYDRQGRIINIGFVPISGDAVDIEFTRGGSHDITGRGDAERVFGTVLQAIQIYLSRYRQPDYVLFSGKETSRNKLYLRLVARYAARFGYKITTQDQLPDELRTMALPKDVFILSKSITNENFADGQVKGKSRPGRVKRAGASCAGSVSELRARAKKYGGEKGKMYHWCANMKGGRK